MPNYDQSKIYRLIDDDGFYYYGSTIDTLPNRFSKHKYDAKTRASRVYKHLTGKGWEKVKIELVEEFKCANKKELVAKEQEYISNNQSDKCLNTQSAYSGLTPTEYIKRWRSALSEERKEAVLSAHAQRRREKYATLTDEQKAVMNEKRRKRRAELS